MGSAVRFACLCGKWASIDAVKSGLSELGFPAAPADREEAAEYCVAFIAEVDPTLIEYVEELSKTLQVIVVLIPTPGGAWDTRWELLNAGAMDVLAWSDERALPDEIAARIMRWVEIGQLVDSDAVRRSLVGVSPCWQSLKRKLVEASVYSPGNVLLVGETGTGKEQIAKAIYLLNKRTSKPDLVVVDCTTLSPEFSGSELFGHERGAFTGAVAERDGAFALANGGTLFLDEIGELPLQLQAQLLRVIQEHTYKRVGGNVWHRTEFRLICATNRDLERLVREGGFRGDLYYRIADWVIRPPPLRERRADILPLARHFLMQPPATAPHPRSTCSGGLSRLPRLSRQCARSQAAGDAPPFTPCRQRTDHHRRASRRRPAGRRPSDRAVRRTRLSAGDPACLRPRHRPQGNRPRRHQRRHRPGTGTGERQSSARRASAGHHRSRAAAAPREPGSRRPRQCASRGSGESLNTADEPQHIAAKNRRPILRA